jgi:hypothetical protein
MWPVSNRLLRAVERGLLEPLRHYDFAATGGGGGYRGETVECSNGQTLIVVSADWLEGELSLTVQQAGASPVPITDFIDLSRIKGLHLTRLGRNVSTDTVEATLRKIGAALDEQAGSALGRRV